jgi:hypothetical protein
MAKTDVAKSSEMRPWEALQSELQAVSASDADNSFEIAAAVIDQIATATSPDQIFAANESGPADVADYLNRPLNVYDARYHPSAERFRDGSLGYYVVFNSLTDEGEDVLLSCGASNVVASLWQLQKIGAFDPDKPCRLVIRGRETARGTLYTVHSAA